MFNSSVPTVPAKSLLESLRARGFRLHVEGDKLLVSPAAGLADTDRRAIANNKPGLIVAIETWDREVMEAALDGSRLVDAARFRRLVELSKNW